MRKSRTDLFHHAIVRTPGSNFEQGLTSVDLGIPNYARALAQHSNYCEALRECGLAITKLDADVNYPDSTFVEDTAVLTAGSAILTRPGALSREGEIAAIRPCIEALFPATLQIEAPGTLDGGDVCEAEDHFFIGLSHRTNEEGARQLAQHLSAQGFTSSILDVRRIAGILHLKSGISYIGGNTLVVIEEMAENELFRDLELVKVPANESYAVNCVRVNGRVLIAAGFPRLRASLVQRGFHPLALEMSEFQKMDGGLSCLSLRF